MTLNHLMANVEYPFITITSRFTLTRIRTTWEGPIYGSNRTNYVCNQMIDVKFWLLYSNTWNHLIMCKKNPAQVLFRMLSTKCLFKSYIYIYMIYMYTVDLALNNLQWLICHKTQPNPTKPNFESVNCCIKTILSTYKSSFSFFSCHIISMYNHQFLLSSWRRILSIFYYFTPCKLFTPVFIDVFTEVRFSLIWFGFIVCLPLKVT